MSQDERVSYRTLSLRALERVNQVCVAFEEAYQKNEFPKIEAYLTDTRGAERNELLFQLLLLDLHYLARQRVSTSRDDYYARFPGAESLIDRAFVALSSEPPLLYSIRDVSGEIRAAASVLRQLQIVPLHQSGATIDGRYVLERELGRGGMGVVYAARDERLKRPVAVKFMLPPRHGQTAEEVKRLETMFYEEAQLGANLLHPAIATVFDYGFYENKPYTVFEYVSGESLRAVLHRRKRLPLDEVRMLLPGLAQGLDFAHARHVIHRDLKPENIRATGDLQFKILDLGLAKKFLTEADWHFAGTPAYASPEQAAEQPSDGRADQYALAVIVYELLTGQRPFAASDVVALLDSHRNDPPPPPRSVVPDLDASAEAAILRALAKDPRDRFEACEQFALALGCQFFTQPHHRHAIVREADVSVRVLKRNYLALFFLGALRLPAFTRRSRYGHVVRTGEALWSIHKDEVARWKPEQIRLETHSSHTLVVIAKRPNFARQRLGFRFKDAEEALAWRNDIAAYVQSQAGSTRAGAGSDAPTRGFGTPAQPQVVLIGRRPEGRFQNLEVVQATAPRKWMAIARLKLRAAVQEADAVTDIQTERVTDFAGTRWRLSGLAMRAVDASGRRELKARWFTESATGLGRWYLGLLLALAGVLIVNQTVRLMSLEVPAGTALAEASAFLGWTMGWPLLLSAFFLLLRWPQLARPLVIASGAVIALGSTAIAGGFLVVPLAYYAGKIWRTRAEYRRLEAPYASQTANRRSALGWSCTLVSAAMTVLVVGFVVRETVAGYVDPSRVAAEAANTRGIAYLERGQLDLALDAFSEAIRRSGDSPDFFSNRSVVHHKTGQLNEALSDANRALGMNPLHVGALVARSSALLALGRTEEALANLNDAIRSDPQCGEAFSNRARVHLRLGDAKAAAKDANEAIRLGGGVESYVNRAAASLELGKPDLAIRDCDEALARGGPVAHILANRAAAHIQKGEFDQAKEDCTQAIKLDPTLAIAFANLGRAHHLSGSHTEAFDAFEAALDRDPKCITAYVNRAALHGETGDLEAAVKDCDNALEVDEESVLAYINRGYAHLRKGDTGSAAADLDRALELAPENVRARVNRVALCLRVGDPESALKHAEKAVTHAPGEADAYSARAHAHLRLRQLDEAIRDFQRAVELQPKMQGKVSRYIAGAYYDRGLQRRQAGNQVGALNDYSLAIAWDEGLAEPYCNRSELHLSQGRYAKAFADADKAIRCRPEFALAYANRGAARTGLGQFQDALNDCNTAIDLDPSLAIAYMNRGLLRYQKGQLDMALRDLNDAVARDDKRPLVFVNRAVVHLARGDLDRAVADWRSAAALDPTLVPQLREVPLLYLDRARTRREHGDLEGALEDERKARKLAEELGPER